MNKPERPDGCPLFAHANKQWAKKVKGKLRYYGPWGDLPGALAMYEANTNTTPTPSVATKAKPTKPKGFPLTVHSSGQWCKKINGKTHYFGVLSDPNGALKRYQDLLAGRTVVDGLTLKDLVNSFLRSKKRLVKSGELRQCTWDDYHRLCESLIKEFGLTRSVSNITPTDFEKLREKFAETHGACMLRKDVTYTRSLFTYAYEVDLIDKPVKFGPVFKAPKQVAMRKERQERGQLMFEAREVRAMVAGASLQLRAMILLGVNCGFGNHDCATLPRSAIDGRWITFPRPKTSIERRCYLWPETVKALGVLPKHELPNVFVTKYGKPWAPKSKGSGGGPITYETRKLLVKLSLKTKGRNFYSLRRVFETVAGETGDQVAVDHVMGHSDPSMAAIYRQSISDKRLIAVANFVRKWYQKKVSSVSRGR